MKGIPLLAISVAVLGLLILTGSDSNAGDVTVYVTIQGVQLPGNINFVQLAPACQNPPAYDTTCIVSYPSAANPDFTVRPKDPSKRAQVIGDDGPTDLLKLDNTIIKPSRAYVTGSMLLWANFLDDGPVAPPTVRWERWAKGTLKRGNSAAERDWYEVQGWVAGVSIDGRPRKTVPDGCTSMLKGCGTIDLRDADDWNWLSGPRELKLEFVFYMESLNDTLDHWVQLQNVAPGESTGGDPTIGVKYR